MTTTLHAAVLSLLAAVAPADAPAAPADAPPAARPPPALDLRPLPGLDLVLQTPEPLPRDPAFEERVQRRRAYLSAHQAAGIATWGLMATTVVVGQLNFNDLYGGGGYTQRFREPHVFLAGATTVSFAFTGILALAAPGPYRRPSGFDTATAHEAAMALTTLGLLGQVGLGWVTHNPGRLDQRHLAIAHQALGYATFGTMTLGAVTLLF